MKRLFALAFLAAVLAQNPVFAVNDGNGRPKVGVVLAGGGAKGAAHVGILKYLEEQGIPVDFIAGTSMGSIIGGLYSIGYTSSQLDSVIKAVDWQYYFSNVVNRKNRSYTDKYLGDKYGLNIPFSFKDRERSYDFHTRQNANELESKGELVNRNSLPPIMRSLAAGIVDGDKLENLFNELCTGYLDSLDFNDFPIPFTCIATDLLGGKEYEIHSGRLPFAMRASMSIPIMFPPVDYDGRLLVDGGMVNNFPSDICRRMGADIIIGVELNEGFRADKKDINSMPGLLAQLFKIVTSGHNAENRKLCDVYIQPNVSGYGMMSFSTQSVDSLIAHGYNAAKECAEGISAIKASLGEYAARERPARNAMKGSDEIHLTSISISGLNSKEVAWMTSKWHPEFEKKTTVNDIRNVIAKYKGTGMFTAVNYALTETEDGERLDIKFTKKQPNAARVGLWIDSEEAIALGLNFGIRENELQGLKGNFDARISSNPYINLRGTLAIPSVFNVNLDGGIRFTRKDIYSEGMIWGSSRLMNASGRFYLSNYYSRLSNIRGGLQFEWNREYETDYALDSYGEKRMSCNAALFLDFAVDSRDHDWKASRGMMMNISGKYRFWSNDEYWKIINPDGGLLTANMSAECYISPGNGPITFIPQFYSRIWFGEYCDVNTMNCIGGWQNGRYGEQHLPFIGLSNTELLDGQDVAIARLDARWHIGGIHYLTGIYNHVWSEGAYSNNGAALKYTLDLPIGPLSFYALWSDIPATYPKWNIGLSFGTYF